MAKFLAIPTLPVPVTPEEAAFIGKAVKGNVTVDAYWVSSWAQLNDEGNIVRIYCEWNAKSADAVPIKAKRVVRELNKVFGKILYL